MIESDEFFRIVHRACELPTADGNYQIADFVDNQLLTVLGQNLRTNVVEKGTG